jgi:hypothetical protein
VQVDLAPQWPTAGGANDAFGDGPNALNTRIVPGQDVSGGLAEYLQVGLLAEGKLLFGPEGQLLRAVAGTLTRPIG